MLPTRAHGDRKLFIVVLLCLLSIAAEAQDSEPGIKLDSAVGPNIVFILADDLGYGDLGAYGQDMIKTPNLDRMANEGMRFSAFYSGSTVCRPARCALMTGLHSGHCYIRSNREVSLRASDVTVAEALKAEGYATAMIGKWALGEEGTSGIPTRQGFDYFYGYLNQTHAHNYYPEFLFRNEEKVYLSIVEVEGFRQHIVFSSNSKGDGHWCHYSPTDRSAWAFLVAFILVIRTKIPKTNAPKRKASLLCPIIPI